MLTKRGAGLQYDLMKNFDLPDYKAVFLLYKYAKHFLGWGNSVNKEKVNIETFEDLRNYHACIKPHMTEEFLDALYVVDDKFKKAEKWLLDKLHQQKEVSLYHKLYEQDLAGDVKSIKEFMGFSKSFLKDDADDELSQFLNGVDFSDEESE